jgi:hypothetical protein
MARKNDPEHFIRVVADVDTEDLAAAASTMAPGCSALRVRPVVYA